MCAYYCHIIVHLSIASHLLSGKLYGSDQRQPIIMLPLSCGFYQNTKTLLTPHFVQHQLTLTLHRKEMHLFAPYSVKLFATKQESTTTAFRSESCHSFLAPYGLRLPMAPARS